MTMAFLQDKKLIMHISLEIITLGSLSYFFYNRTKNLENRLENRIDHLVKVTGVLQEEILQLKKHIASSSFELDEEYKLFKMFKERDLKNKFMNEQTNKTQSKQQQVRQVNSVQQMSAQMSAQMSSPTSTTTRVPPTQDEYIAIFSNSVPSFKHTMKSPPAIVELMEDEDNENENHNENHDIDDEEKHKKQTDAELDEELGLELKELNELVQ